MTALSVGFRAPDFELPRKIGEAPYRLSAHLEQGPVVVLFFPLAFSGVCTKEICAVAEDFDSWTDLGAEVVAISVDSAFVNHRFAQETGATFPILSDFNKETAAAYGVLNDDYFGMRGVADRSAFLVSQDGTIRYSWMGDDSDGLPDFDAIKAAVRDLT